MPRIEGAVGPSTKADPVREPTPEEYEDMRVEEDPDTARFLP